MAQIKKNRACFSVTMSPSLLEKLDAQAEEYGMNRSAFIAMAVTMYFKTEEAKTAISKASEVASIARQLQNDTQTSLWAQDIASKL